MINSRYATHIILDVELRSTGSSTGKDPGLVAIGAGYGIGSSYRLVASPRITNCVGNCNHLCESDILDLDNSISTVTSNLTHRAEDL